MNHPTILNARGTPLVGLGGDRAWKQFIKGDIVVSLQWIDVQASDPGFEEEGPVPCMVLFHAHRRATTAAYVIPQVNAFAYAKASGNGPADSFILAIYNALEMLGFDRNDKAAKHLIYDAVMEAMHDLINMPTTQPDALHNKAPVYGIEAAMKINGKTIQQDLL